MCTYIEPTISQVLSQLCDINFLSSYPPSIVHCQVCEGLPASPAAPHPPHDHPPILLKIFFPLSTFIILVFGDFCHTWCYLYQSGLPCFVWNQEKKGEGYEGRDHGRTEGSEDKIRKRAERGRNRGMSDEVKGEGCQRGNVWSVRDWWRRMRDGVCVCVFIWVNSQGQELLKINNQPPCFIETSRICRHMALNTDPLKCLWLCVRFCVHVCVFLEAFILFKQNDSLF